jgi:hypothetical protein
MNEVKHVDLIIERFILNFIQSFYNTWSLKII